MKFVKFAAASALMLMLAGCADTIHKPVALTALSADRLATIHISKVTADAEKGLKVTQDDLNPVCAKVRSYIIQGSPGVFVDGASGDALVLKMHFTRFDHGSAIARFILIGLGQIHIDADVTLEQPDGTVVAKYKVKKTFAWGGMIGGTTSFEDVEEGFAKSVAEVVKTPAA